MNNKLCLLAVLSTACLNIKEVSAIMASTSSMSAACNSQGIDKRRSCDSSNSDSSFGNSSSQQRRSKRDRSESNEFSHVASNEFVMEDEHGNWIPVEIVPNHIHVDAEHIGEFITFEE